MGCCCCIFYEHPISKPGVETKLHFSHPKSFILKIRPRTASQPLIFTMTLEWQELCPVAYHSQGTQSGELWCSGKQEVGENDQAPPMCQEGGGQLGKSDIDKILLKCETDAK